MFSVERLESSQGVVRALDDRMNRLVEGPASGFDRARVARIERLRYPFIEQNQRIRQTAQLFVLPSLPT
jgi:hypothetical protein